MVLGEGTPLLRPKLDNTPVPLHNQQGGTNRSASDQVTGIDGAILGEAGSKTCHIA